MDIQRKPFQIVLIEQIFYPFIFVLGVVLLISFVMPGVAKISSLETRYIVYGFIGFGIAGLYGMLYLWLPYTLIRVWLSASTHLKGISFYLFKAYAGILFVCLVASALYSLYYLPEIFNAVLSQNK